MLSSRINFPNFLTLSRLFFSTTILPVFLVFFLPYNLFWLNCVLAAFFGFISFTDFLDGYLARRFNQETDLGKVLDPIADKFLLYATLLSLVYIHKIYFYFAIILIGREFFIAGLREAGGVMGVYLPVSYLGKLKTTFQNIFLLIAIANPYQDLGIKSWFNVNQWIFMWVSILASLFSAYSYYNNFLKNYSLSLSKNLSKKEDD